MSLVVVLKSRQANNRQNEFERHIPFSQNGIPNLPLLKNEEIDFIQADGHELDAIRDRFGLTIPFCGNRVVRWYGDIAKTIYFNLR